MTRTSPTIPPQEQIDHPIRRRMVEAERDRIANELRLGADEHDQDHCHVCGEAATIVRGTKAVCDYHGSQKHANGPQHPRTGVKTDRGEYWPTVAQASRDLGIQASSIIRAMAHGWKSAGRKWFRA